ncbi:hypothetical protein ACULNC_15440 [Shigella flexneri]
MRILGSADRLMEVIREELELVREQFGDKRRTEITANSADINLERSDHPGRCGRDALSPGLR